MSKDKDSAAALTGFVGFLVLTTLCSPAAVTMIQKIPAGKVPVVFGKIDNQFVGILMGIISAKRYNRFGTVELSKARSSFSDRRLVPIITSFVMILVAFIMMAVWPMIVNVLVNFGVHIQKMGSVGADIYAFFNRLLIPVGLHHALNSVFWFDVAGINNIPNFLGGAQSIDAGKAMVGITGRYQAGFLLIMMFGLPGAALAIIVKIFNTNHAFCLETVQGAEIVVHMGLDTAALNGQGFTRLLEEGAEVTAGQPVLKMDLTFLNAHARSMISPVVCSTIDDFGGLVMKADTEVVAGQSPPFFS